MEIMRYGIYCLHDPSHYPRFKDTMGVAENWFPYLDFWFARN